DYYCASWDSSGTHPFF
nr:immunoglobulin light chain junction region [Macaca mulatta]MOX42670.1 immunoglobulin light chain junction region [Macaca mulatta]MOX43666.1 immunoglobulin light chain junction region [Macaca mulatta]MOX44456.1 immunoglobulin light chain junction region [Macaca mulatta]MOX44675.1 immunoglobulin light chain junction region [Macaca mulatta]